MVSYTYGEKSPVIDPSAYVFPNATVIGNVRIGGHTWVGPGAVLRGDYGRIEVGSYTAIEDNCVIHARPGEVTKIGDHVTLGHLSVVHTATIKDWAVLGMGTVISDFAVMGEWSALGEGAVVKNKDQIEDGRIAVGVPAKVVGEVNEKYKELWVSYKARYNAFCESYNNSLKRSD